MLRRQRTLLGITVFHLAYSTLERQSHAKPYLPIQRGRLRNASLSCLLHLFQQRGKFFSHRRGSRVIRQILPFGWVSLMVIQFNANDGIAFVPPFGVTP